MFYYNEDDNARSDRKIGVVATVIYAVAVALLLLLLKMPRSDDMQGSEGVMIAFGDALEAGGDGMVAQEEDVTAEHEAEQDDTAEDEPLLTQDHEDAPEAPAPPPEPAPIPRPRPVQQPAPERRPDPNALFPGQSAGRGAAEAEGQQGAEYGDPDGDTTGTGLGTQGVGFDLAGRRIAGALPLPTYRSNKSGRVVVDITVDSDGNVVRAVQRVQGSTTRDSELITAAIEAARRARFSVAEDAGLQNGTITYNYILK